MQLKHNRLHKNNNTSPLYYPIDFNNEKETSQELDYNSQYTCISEK